MSAFRVVISAIAEAQIRAVVRWWRKHRLDASDLFERELAAALDRLAEVPFSGARYPAPRPAGVRRLLLGKSQYHVYYSVEEASQQLIVRAVWHTSRGHGPTLG